MPKIKKNIPSFLEVKKDETKSRFVLDLKKMSEGETKKNSFRKMLQMGTDFKQIFTGRRQSNKNETVNVIDNLPKVDTERWKVEPEKNSSNSPLTTHHSPSTSPFTFPFISKTEFFGVEKEKFNTYYETHFQRLAIVNLLFFIYKIFTKLFQLVFKTSYYTGWFSIFIVKFFSLSIFTLLRAFMKGLILPVSLIFTTASKQAAKKTAAFFSLLYYGVKKNTLSLLIFTGKAIILPFSLIKKSALAFSSLIKASGYKLFHLGKGATDISYKAALASGEIAKKSIKAGKNFDYSVLKPKPSLTAGKRALAFCLIGVLLIIPFKAFTSYQALNLDDIKEKILGQSKDAVGNIVNAGKALSGFQFTEAQASFSNAGKDFLKAEKTVGEVNDTLLKLAAFAPDKNIRMAAESKKILAAGREAANLGANLTAAMNILFSQIGAKQQTQDGRIGKADEQSNDDEIDSSSAVAGVKIAAKTEGEEKNLVEVFQQFNPKLKDAIDNVENLKSVVNEIDEDNLPDQFKENFTAIKNNLEQMETGLKEFLALTEKLNIILGGEADKRYLLVFQNNAEMRGSGGFIGSYALLDFSKGKIENLEAPGGGGYDTEAGMREIISSPEPLKLLKPRWYFWDANWWPDWPASAKKLAWFYERSDGSTVDGVIAVTPTVMERLLAVIGPIDMREKYGIEINKDNFWEVTQKIVEDKGEVNGKEEIVNSKEKIVKGEEETVKGAAENQDVDNKKQDEAVLDCEVEGNNCNQPKRIIGDMMKIIIDELPNRTTRDNFPRLIKLFETNLNEKQLLANFNNQELQDELASMNWDGAIKNNGGDYLMVVNSNIGGQKSDRKIKQTLYHTAEVQADGSIIDSLKIKRLHNGIKGEEFTGVRNVNWMRIYVPKGAELIEASGFQPVDKELFKKSDLNWKEDPEYVRGEGTAKTDELSGTKIYAEFDKTVFANWSQVDPGETAEIYLKYRLPQKISAQPGVKNIFEKLKAKLGFSQETPAYNLLIQKQPGALETDFNSLLKLPENYEVIWQYPEENSTIKDGWQVSGDLAVDRYLAVLLNKH